LLAVSTFFFEFCCPLFQESAGCLNLSFVSLSANCHFLD